MNQNENNDSLDFRRLWRAISKGKFLYLLSALFFAALAIFYCLYKMPAYKTTATILIEDSASGGASGLGGAGGVSNIMKTFSMGGFASSSVDNEILILESNKVLSTVVETLGLNITYIENDGISRKQLYKNSPVIVEATDSFFYRMKENLQLKIKLKDGKADIKLCSGFMGMNTVSKFEDVLLPVKIDTEAGDIYVMKSPSYVPSEDCKLTVKLTNTASIVKGLRQMLSIDFCNKLADAIQIEIKYPNRELGEQIVNTLMAEYNNSRRERRMTTSREESAFLENRINELLPEILAAEENIAEFVKANKMTGIEEEAKLIVASAVKGNTNKVKQEFEVSYYNEVLDKLNNKERQLIPVIEGLGNPMIKDYNELVIERNNLATSAKPGNPRIAKMDNTLDMMRLSIMDNVNAALDTIRMSSKVSSRLLSNADKTRDKIPVIQMEYANLVRDTRFKNELYSFLVQKRENALLNAASTDAMGFIIDPAYTDEKPDLTKAIVVVIICIILALICPTVAIVVLFFSRKAYVNGLMDLNFDNLENNAVEYTGHDWQVSMLRNKILETPDRKLLLVANIDKGADMRALTGELCNSFDKVGEKCVVRNPVLENKVSINNDDLLSPEFKKNVEGEINGGNFVLVLVPDAEKFAMLSPKFVTETTQVLLVVPSPNYVLRKSLKKIVEPIVKATRVVTCLYRI